jgi:hypothetical protein
MRQLSGFGMVGFSSLENKFLEMTISDNVNMDWQVLEGLLGHFLIVIWAPVHRLRTVLGVTFVENIVWALLNFRISFGCQAVFKLSITWQTKAIFILSKIKKGYNIKRYWQIKRLISEKKFQTNLTKLITSADGISFRMTFQFPSSNRKLSIWKKVTIIKVKFDRLG